MALRDLIPGLRAASAAATDTVAALEAAETPAAELQAPASPETAAAAPAAPAPAAELQAPATTETAAAAPAAPAPAAAAPSPADPGMVAEACTKAGVPALAKPLIDGKAPMAEVERRIETAGQIRKAVELAAKASPAIDPRLADGYIVAGASLAHVQSSLLQLMADAQAPAVNASSPSVTGGGAPAELNPTSVYAARRKARETMAVGG